MRVEEGQLKAFILDLNILSAKILEEVKIEATKKKVSLEKILLEKQLISPEELQKLKAYILGIPFVSLEKEIVPLDILQIIPEPIASKHNIVAFRKQGKRLEVAMTDPADLQTIEFIKKKSNLEIAPRITDLKSIKAALKQYSKSLHAEFGQILEEGSVKAQGAEEKSDLRKVAEELPIIRIVDTLIKHAILQQASDIHIEPAEKEISVRYRIDGILHDAMTLPKQVHDGIMARIKVLSDLKIDEHRLPQDGRFKIDTGELKVSFRVSIFPVYFGEKTVLRLLPEEVQGYTLEELGFWGELLEKVHENINRPHGLILVTGPTGSGKTTTLYTILDILNTTDVNIATIEDPIEYQLPRINQTQVRPQIGLTFANGLRSLVRQDPDIIMVGEIRDNETAGLAINAALTGHLVLSTLHTNDAVGAIPRLIDMKVEPFLIASTLNLVIAQRLIRRICQGAGEKYLLDKKEVAVLQQDVDLEKILNVLKQQKIIDTAKAWETLEFIKPKGTKDCPDGYKGRIGIFEVLEITDSLRALISRASPLDEIEKETKKQNFLTMLEDGIAKAVQGSTSIEEVLRAAKE